MATAKNTSYSAGLDHLQHLAMVHIKQKPTAFSGNKYRVLTPEGKDLFIMKEDGGMLTFLASGRSRGFHMDAVDDQGKTAFTLRRPGVFFSDKVECSMNGALVSIVRKENTFVTPLFSINDASDAPVLRVKGDVMDYEFELQTRDKRNIGSISKKYRGFVQEMFSYADDYFINFPVDLDVRYKAATISACILIDYRYHEK